MKSGVCRVVGWMLFAAMTSVFAAEGPAANLLVDQYNQPVPPGRLTGHWLLVYFGYTRCHDVCPSALTRMKTVLTGLESSGPSILPVFITLDPADTPARLREFATRFNPRMLAMTGSPAAIAEAASRFGVVWHPSADKSDLDHGALWYLVSPDSRVVRFIHPTQSAAEITETIRATFPDQPSKSLILYKK